MDATNHGGYTWKPICIRDALYEWKAVVMWNDAGNQFREYALRGLSLVKQDVYTFPKMYHTLQDGSIHFHINSSENTV